MKKLFLILLLRIPFCSGAQFMVGEPGLLYATAASTPFQTETTNYLTAETAAGKTFTVAQQDSIDRFWQSLHGLSNPKYTTYDVHSKFVAIYPLLTGVSAYDRINMASPGTYDCTETGTPTMSAVTMTVAFNGTSNYWDSQFIPGNSGTTAAFSGFGIYRTDVNVDANATFGVASGGNSYNIGRNDAFNQMVVCGSNASSGSIANKHFKMSVYSSASQLDYSSDGAIVHSSTGLTMASGGLKSILIGAFNAASPSYGGASTVGFIVIVKGTWTSSEVQTLFYEIQDLKQSVGGVTFP